MEEEFIKEFPEIRKTKKTSEINWDNCVVWKEEDYFYFIESKEIMYVSWSFGILSIIPSPNSFISNKLTAILINSKCVFIGKNIKVSN
ncbi:MAG: hypothetical protein N2Z20_04305 [Elusimicrobiales bacterium]|nr:hypothetical protein [Elusimicrobiales bacterium]